METHDGNLPTPHHPDSGALTIPESPCEYKYITRPIRVFPLYPGMPNVSVEVTSPNNSHTENLTVVESGDGSHQWSSFSQ